MSFVLGARNVSKISQVIHKEKAVEVAIDYDESAYAFEFLKKGSNQIVTKYLHRLR